MKLIALHGNIGSPKDFFLIPEAEAIDLWQYSHLSLPEAAKQIDSDTDTNSPRAVIGYSMGGRLALHLLTTNPTGWDFAVIISAHPGLTSKAERQQRNEQDQQWADKARNLEWSEFLQAWNAQSILKGQPPSPEQQQLEAKKEAIAQAFENWSLGEQEDLTNGLCIYTNPLHWVVGGQDEKFRTIATQVTPKFENHKLEIFENCGHRILQESPDKIKTLLRLLIEVAN